MREELRQLQQRMQSLEKKLQEIDAAPAPQASSPPQSESALNPGVSAILNGVHSNLSRDPNTYRLNGFVPTMGDVSPGRRGLSLGESELGLAANIDPLFRGTLIAAISPDNDSIGVEEGYIQTLGLSQGFTLKAGRFFSSVGYQNQVHAHAWDFTDAPLANKVKLVTVRSKQYYGEGYQDILTRVPSVRNAKKYLAWKPKTDLPTALRKTLDYHLGRPTKELDV
jgi:hypothetical protein